MTSHSPSRATHNGTDDQRGQDAEFTHPVQREHPPVCSVSPFTAAAAEPGPHGRSSHHSGLQVRGAALSHGASAGSGSGAGGPGVEQPERVLMRRCGSCGMLLLLAH